jgi:hypothetical protein
MDPTDRRLASLAAVRLPRAFGWRYARREIVALPDRIAPLAAPAAPVAVADLLP